MIKDFKRDLVKLTGLLLIEISKWLKGFKRVEPKKAPGCVAFYPWLNLKEKKEFDGFELIPFRLEDASLQLSKESEDQDARGVISNYYDQVGKPIRNFVILRQSGTQSNQPLESAIIDKLFVFNEIVAFAGLSGRRFFSYSYWNRDNFQLVIQKFVGDDYTPSVVTRRRDGSLTQGFSKGMFRATCPLHVTSTDTVDIDENLVNLLIAIWNDDIPEWPMIYESIQAFNLANTDSNQIREHHELVILNGCFERIFDLGKGKMEPLRDAFIEALEEVPQAEDVNIEKDLGKMTFKTHFPLREAFIRDLFNIRGNLAHGKINHGYPSIWTEKEHLLLASYIFPLVVKFLLSKASKYSLSSEDKTLVYTFDHLLASKNLMGETSPGSYEYVWSQIARDSKWSSPYVDWSEEGY